MPCVAHVGWMTAVKRRREGGREGRREEERMKEYETEGERERARGRKSITITYILLAKLSAFTSHQKETVLVTLPMGQPFTDRIKVNLEA